MKAWVGSEELSWELIQLLIRFSSNLRSTCEWTNLAPCMDKPLFKDGEFVPIATTRAVQKLTFSSDTLKLGLVGVAHLISNRMHLVARQNFKDTALRVRWAELHLQIKKIEYWWHLMWLIGLTFKFVVSVLEVSPAFTARYFLLAVFSSWKIGVLMHYTQYYDAYWF